MSYDQCWPRTNWPSAPPAPAPADSGPVRDAHTPCPSVSVPEMWHNHISSEANMHCHCFFFFVVVVTLCFVIRFTTPSLQRPVVPWGSPSPFLGFPARSCGVGWGCHALSLRWPCLLPPVWSLAVDPGLSTWTGRHMTKRHHCQQSVFNHTVAKAALTEWLFTQHGLIFWVAQL